MTHEKKSRETATESLGTLLNNGEPDLRREVLKHLGDKEFMRACLLSHSTVTANMDELLLRTKTAEEEWNRHYKEAEEVFKKDAVIKSLTYAVQRLADTLGTKEVELETKEIELEAKAAELKMKDRAEVDMECKMLDQLIEIAELKNHVTDLTEGRASTPQDTPTSQQSKNQRTRTTSDGYSSFELDTNNRPP